MTRHCTQIQRPRNSTRTPAEAQLPRGVCPPFPFLSSPLPPSPTSSVPPSLSLAVSVSYTYTLYSVQSGREALTTGSQGVHPEAPKNFLALTLVTKAMQFWGGGGAQCRLAHKEDTLWQNNNNNYNNNIIHPGQTQLPQANCTVQVSG